MSKPKSQAKDNHELKHDPQENDPRLGPIIKKAVEEARQKVHRRYALCEGAYRLTIGHEIWVEQQKILKERGINWKSPAEMNPGVMID